MEESKKTSSNDSQSNNLFHSELVFILLNIVLSLIISFTVVNYVHNQHTNNSDLVVTRAQKEDVINPIDSVLYINTTQRYQIRYPKLWYVIPNTTDPLQKVVQFSTHYTNINSFEADGKYLFISVIQNTPEIDALFASKAQPKALPGQLTKVADLTIDGYPAIEAIHDNIKVKDEFRQENIYFIKQENVVYQLDFIVYDEDIIPPHARLYRQIAKSFKKF